MDRADIKSSTLEELKTAFQKEGQKPFRALQVYRWLSRGVESFDEMTDLPGELRERLEQSCTIATAHIEHKFVSKRDKTVKYVFRLCDGELVECVLMRYHHGLSACISTQVGCRMGCTFCATGKGGFSRNLTASEMLAEVQTAQRDAGERISSLVLMGMGEPLDNFENVLRFLKLITSPEGLNLGMRHISLSTCGLVDKIDELAQHNLQLTLSVSLHAPNDALRSKTMLVNRRWGVEELLQACRRYVDRTGRRISFEYAMIGGVNDSDSCARELAHRLRGMLCHVNLIPVNPIEESRYQKSPADRLRRFSQILAGCGIPVTVRRTLGSDINASCGQLRRRSQEGAVQP